METSWSLGYTGHQTLSFIFLKCCMTPCALNCDVLSNNVDICNMHHMINKQTQSFVLIQLCNQSNFVLHAVICLSWLSSVACEGIIVCMGKTLCAAAGSYPFIVHWLSPYCSHAPLLSGVTHRPLSDGSFITSYTHWNLVHLNKKTLNLIMKLN